MPIYANNLVISGTLSGTPLYANTVTGNNEGSSINIKGDVAVEGSLFTKGRIDFSDTMFLTMRPTNDLLIATGERIILGDDMIVDAQCSDASALANLTDVASIWNWENGTFTIPVDGLYNLELQGSFSNSQPDAVNGVYWYLKKQAHANARIAANISRSSQIVSSSSTRFLLKGDVIQPVFYTSDPDAKLLANGETYISSLIVSTNAVDHDKYYRVPEAPVEGETTAT